MKSFTVKTGKFGTAPVFFTAIATILGAIMFLRFGYVVGSVGFFGALGIIVLGHIVTIFTALAISEIATNQKVEGGGEYFIISRSFGINIGASIGVALYLSQAISVAFYLIAFAEAFTPIYDWLNANYALGIEDKRWISIPGLVILSIIMLTKGASLGVKVLYIIIGILFASITSFFLGSNLPNPDPAMLFSKVENPDPFFFVFAICFPAFTGMTAGVGLSGDLKNPKKSIPLGTIAASVVGMIIYVFLALKLSYAATPEELVNDQLIMSKIAIWGPIIPIGLAAATVSSALGSIMVAPRTLQSLAKDNIFPWTSVNGFFKKLNKKDEPFNATLLSLFLAFFFILLGDVNTVARIISMFFMVTYGAICVISFLQHFAADPAYRPSFKSPWYLSLAGAVFCIYLMFKMQPYYAIFSIVIMLFLYVGITRYSGTQQGMARIFQGVIFQLSRNLQVFLQKSDKAESRHWRPSVICISHNSFNHFSAFDLMRWISERYGFGTYMHFIKDFVGPKSNREADEILERLIQQTEHSHSNVYMDTLISPSYTTAIAQAVQIPGISGKENNLFMFEFNTHEWGNLEYILDNLELVRSSNFDLGILMSSGRAFGFKREIHIWFSEHVLENANLMILLAYIILGHKEWKHAHIKIFALVPNKNHKESWEHLVSLSEEGRLPIAPHNIVLIDGSEILTHKQEVVQRSKDADLTLIGFKIVDVLQHGEQVFQGFDELGNVLFINSKEEKIIE